MSEAHRDIDALIEDGLSRYGVGDLDGALLVWEQVLQLDPDNPQANSYVDYVRLNYELLTNGGEPDGAPFPLETDEPEYQIEIIPGEIITSPAPRVEPRRDDGWFVEDELHVSPSRPRSHDAPPPDVELELEADEPPLPVRESSPTTFDSDTREYGTPDLNDPDGDAKTPARIERAPSEPHGIEFEGTPTPGFGFGDHDLSTPTGFASQLTDVKKRDLGFVQPSGEHRVPHDPPELKMTLRTPTPPPIDLDGDEPEDTEDTAEAIDAGIPEEPLDLDGDTDGGQHAPLELDPGPSSYTTDEGDDSDEMELATPTPAVRPKYMSEAIPTILPPSANLPFELSYEAPDDPPPRITQRTVSVPDPNAPDDLIASLPSPRPTNMITRDMPATTRPPAGDGNAHSSITRDMAKLSTDSMRPLDRAGGPTREFEANATVKLSKDLLAREVPSFDLRTAARSDNSDPSIGAVTTPIPVLQPMSGAPTRDLGLRQRPATEDEPTHESDVVAIRKHANTRPPSIASLAAGELILNFDPIGERADEILAQIDQVAPLGENKDDRTRRRITALIDAAMVWNGRGEYDKAVAAVDLALGEDPNSALAQKLIHRNRDQIMVVFSAFLGDLARTPVLARPLHELGAAPISPRAAFLLSRIDGTLSLDEILDVSGMPRVEAYRYLCQLFLRGILR